ncbi:MAG: 4Fe-4S binding protein [Bacteroidales bacterium]|jgi:MinD superfamily P-loop ATPase|nr:4Fe-4S binding protein [Bacteroidales bacterium]HPE99859.1 4Fe-4S binding protein [Bacteroidales bacterium]
MEVAVISGKGGTGKSSVVASLASISKNILLADCDVDAANQYLLFQPNHSEEEVFVSGQKAEINYDVCTQCGKCIDYCEFGAISEVNGRVEISEISCDGCRLCERICPVNAISMLDNDKSRLYSGTFRYGHMVYGRLAPGEENSGRLVSLVREKAKEIAKENNYEVILYDGPPGIGCPVISTITGIDKVIIVTEPTLSGKHDLERALETVFHFRIYAMVVINKYDLNAEMTEEIKQYCATMNVPVVALLPYEPVVTEAMVNGKSYVEYAPESIVSKNTLNIWKNIQNEIK